MRGYTRRKIPKGFKIHLPRQACPKCDALLDVTIENGGLIRFTFAGSFRGAGPELDLAEGFEKYQREGKARGDNRGVTSDPEE